MVCNGGTDNRSVMCGPGTVGDSVMGGPGDTGEIYNRWAKGPFSVVYRDACWIRNSLSEQEGEFHLVKKSSAWLVLFPNVDGRRC